jgi:glycosyltransferase involved in cell wall biosynthesis
VEIGQKKYEFHNHPLRLDAVRHLLENVNLVYCSTEALKLRFVSYGLRSTFKVGEIYCSGKVLVPAVDRPVKKIGYMGFDHAHDLETVLPALIQVLRRNPEIEFELFGSIPKPAVLEEFGARVNVIPPVPNYEEFLTKFSSLNWDIGICPLAKTDFNAVKANTKWVEYTSVGTAVVASAETIYDTCCSDGCGALATTTEQWVNAIEVLIHDSHKRSMQVVTAQKRLKDEYSVDRLQRQVLDVLDSAVRLVKSGD